MKSPVSNKQQTFFSLFISSLLFVIVFFLMYTTKVYSYLQINPLTHKIFNYLMKNEKITGTDATYKPSILKTKSYSKYFCGETFKHVSWLDSSVYNMGSDSRLAASFEDENQNCKDTSSEDDSPLKKLIQEAKQQELVFNSNGMYKSSLPTKTFICNNMKCVPFTDYVVIFDAKIDFFVKIALDVLKSVPFCTFILMNYDESLYYSAWGISFLLIKQLIMNQTVNHLTEIPKSLEPYISVDLFTPTGVPIPLHNGTHLWLTEFSMFATFVNLASVDQHFDDSSVLDRSMRDILVDEGGRLVFTNSSYSMKFLNSGFVKFNVDESVLFYYVVSEPLLACIKFLKVPLPANTHVHYFVSFMTYKVSHIGSIYAIFCTVFSVAIRPGVNIYYVSLSIFPFGELKNGTVHDFDSMHHLTSVGTADNSFVLGVVDELFLELKGSESAKTIIERVRMFMLPGQHTMLSQAGSGFTFDSTTRVVSAFKTDSESTADIINAASLIFFSTDLPRKCERMLSRKKNKSFKKRLEIESTSGEDKFNTPAIDMDVPLIYHVQESKYFSEVAYLETSIRVSSSVLEGSQHFTRFRPQTENEECFHCDSDAVISSASPVSSVGGVIIESYDFGE